MVSNFIVLVSVNNPNARKICESVAGREIPAISDSKYSVDIHDFIHATYPELNADDVQVYSLDDLMELNNNEEYYPHDWFMSYMKVAK